MTADDDGPTAGDAPDNASGNAPGDATGGGAGDAPVNAIDGGEEVGAPTLFELFVSPFAVPGGSGATGTVTLTAPAPEGGLTVTLRSDNASVTVPLSVFIEAGQTRATFSITTFQVTVTTGVTITATLDGASDEATLTVTSLSTGAGVDALPNTGVGESPVESSMMWAWVAMLGTLFASLAGYGWSHRNRKLRPSNLPPAGPR